MMLLLDMQTTTIGFLKLLRDRQRALDHNRARRDPLTELSNRVATRRR